VNQLAITWNPCYLGLKYWGYYFEEMLYICDPFLDNLLPRRGSFIHTKEVKDPYQGGDLELIVFIKLTS
jgi:hypothetical protein